MPWSFQQYLACVIALHCTPKNQALFFLSPHIRDLCNTSVIHTGISLSVIVHLAQTNHEFNASSREEAIPIAKPPPLIPAGSRAASPRKQLHSSCPCQPPYPAIWLHDGRGAVQHGISSTTLPKDGLLIRYAVRNRPAFTTDGWYYAAWSIRRPYELTASPRYSDRIYLNPSHFLFFLPFLFLSVNTA
jgi:hypothetical protein